MPSTREEILHFIHAHPLSSTEEISLGLRLPVATIRHHLRELVRQGEITAHPPTADAPESEKRTRGRPGLRYSIPIEQGEHNYQNLLEALLDFVNEGSQGTFTPPAMQEIARRLLPPDFSPPVGSRIRRLNLAIRTLNHSHYHARWEARPNGPWIFLGHCPYAAILPRHPELCRMDTALIESLSGERFSLAVRQTPDSRRQPYCVFCPLSGSTAADAREPIP